MSTEKNEDSFWNAMEKSAAPAMSAPSWKQAGINLSERNYETFSATATLSADSASAKTATPGEK